MVVNPETNTETESTCISIYSQSDILSIQENNDIVVIYSNDRLIKYVTVFTILLFIMPLSFSDLYLAQNDTTCVNSNIRQISITMKSFLIINALFSFGIYLIIIIAICTTSLNKFYESIGYVVDTLIKLILIVFIIIGCVLFWKYMDNSQCSPLTYNYLSVSFIIRIISMSFIFCTTEKIKFDTTE